jgi:hypothetical protein
MEFGELEDLRRFLTEVKARQVSSLIKYHDDPTHGFYHRLESKQRGSFSKASTATCVLSLVVTGRWGHSDAPWADGAFSLGKAMLQSTWESAGLKEGNVFTVSFILEAVTQLASQAPEIETDAVCAPLIEKATGIIQSALSAGHAEIFPYPPSAYVTQLACRTLLLRKALGRETREKVEEWAAGEAKHQIALLLAKSKSADVFQLAYALLLVSSLRPPEEWSPDESAILEAGLKQFFSEQLPDGSWPRSRPLFHYPEVGSAYCYEYEMLTQLLSQRQLWGKLLKYLPNLKISAFALRDTLFALGTEGMGWSSGHHPQLRGPESWSTASVFHFVHAFDRLLAEAIRISIFEYLDTPYKPPQSPKTDFSKFAPGFLDCPITIDNGPRSLRETVFKAFVNPMASVADRIEAGFDVPDDTPMSAIFFGPPGTSKTEICKKIADFLSWPLLSVDPSHFIADGMDRVYAEADRIFGMLSVAERVVVLLDEFDEMVRERETSPDVLSRFLTTAMLPKLATINKNRRILFIVATNHIEDFDIAISRQGRFDVILQVMPPTLDEKLRLWNGLENLLTGLAVQLDVPTRQKLEPLTYLEFKVLANKLKSATTAQQALELIDHASTTATLSAPTEPNSETTWGQMCETQKNKIRIP